MRTLKEKYQSTKLRMAWFVIVLATLMRAIDIITPEIWLGAVTLAFGGYSLANVQQHRIYNQDIGEGVD